jgi:myo-inositol-1-phosphate synthase
MEQKSATAKGQNASGVIKVAIAGLGNCASSLIEGLAYYRQFPDRGDGLLFPVLCGYGVQDIEVVAAFDISQAKVGLPVREAIYQAPNNFVRQKEVRLELAASVERGPTLDGNPDHLARYVTESDRDPVDVVAVLRQCQAQVLVNLLPTGSIEATHCYAEAALAAGRLH